MTPLNSTVRPAESIVRRSASSRWRPGRRQRRVARQQPQLLAVPAHQQQPVVDAQAEPEHGDDVDRARRRASITYEKPSRVAIAPAIDAIAPTIGSPAARNPPNTTSMITQADRQGDALAGAQVDLGLVR